jgi:hypothetical protein
MSVSLRDLDRHVDTLTTPQIDPADIMSQGEARLQRRRTALVVFTTIVAVLSILGARTLLGAVDRSAPPPTNQPKQTHGTRTTQVTPTAKPTRQILYSDVFHIHKPPYYVDARFHFGDRSVETDTWNVHLDATDDGFVYTTDDARLYFSNGQQPRQVGSHVCGRSWNAKPMWIGAYEQDSVVAGNVGSSVVWFECSPAAPGTLVAFDTGSGREVVREQVAACVDRTESPCSLSAVIGDHVYITTERASGAAGPMVVLDLTNGLQRRVTWQAYADDIRSQPRGLVVGDTWQTGSPTDGIGQVFRVRGSQLVPMLDQPGDRDLVAATAFDTATGRAVDLQLPPAHHHADVFTLFEWLDDDTVALAGDDDDGETDAPGDLITCRLSNGHCSLVLSRQEGEVWILPQTILIS